MSRTKEGISNELLSIFFNADTLLSSVGMLLTKKK